MSAQTRKRIYWTNINAQKNTLFPPYDSAIPQPADRGITVTDILENKVHDRYYLRDATVKRLIAVYERENGEGKFSERISGRAIVSPISGGITGFVIHKGSKVPCIGASYGNGYGKRNDRGFLCERLITDYAGRARNNQQKASCISTKGYHSDMNLAWQPPVRVRRLTPTECARLQTVPNWYKFDVTETQQYKLLGNGWTIRVIKHILSFLPGRFKNTTTEDNENKY